MPLQRDCSLDALEENIATLVREGYTPEQAVAIAHEMLDQACEDAGLEPPTKDIDAVTAAEATGIALAYVDGGPEGWDAEGLE